MVIDYNTTFQPPLYSDKALTAASEEDEIKNFYKKRKIWNRKKFVGRHGLRGRNERGNRLP